MGVFDKAEKRIESAVGKVFARAFKGYVHPVEIVAGIQRELDAEAKLLSREKRLVPNAFTIGLSKGDHDRLAPYAKTLNAEILPGIRDHAADRQYVFNGPISIDYVLDEALPTGQFTVASQAVAAESGSREERAATRPGRMVLEVNGVRHELAAPGILIGRGAEADLRLNDPGVSRRHALISVGGDPSHPLITIEDLGSTNGVHVNGARITKTRVGEGARIEIGNTRMLIHTPSEI
ncbi:MAG TPA: FHA domain-containing protein [Tessaracoccus flavescens]|uniref:FHA domain-containing protein n=1 Tax=Tessaracoccus flavescens TaxID=399497 RepID=A0A921EQY7_9ACTN|nr:FHA domain-containing protein [Tessaracoccus flavescens]